MKKLHTKYIIIGAGLSGLTTANQLLKNQENDFIILEGQDRIGGRINTKNGIELGATWFQNHHTYLSQTIISLNLQKFNQYSSGKSVLVYNSMAPAHFFETDPNSPSAFRIANGTMSLINSLVAPLLNKVHLNSIVTDVIENRNLLNVKTINGIYSCEKIILALPPKIASNINFEPKLPDDLIDALETTHTWMSNAIKVGMTFKLPFWREKGFSGTVIGQVGAVTELYDHSNYEDSHYALMGFVNEGLRDLSSNNRKERILNYLEKYLGKEIREYLNYYEKDWSLDKFTSNDSLKSIYISPQYGNPLFEDFYMNEKILFSGAETSPVHGGYMDGAIYSGIIASKKLLNSDH
ncbi:FAD-dependent oxidoreductase [Flavobacteriaceae bacterium AU392]|nr:FAD-dependent oxidoreductase [Flavobacteriaceae bacterium]RKM84788.1 FAD-dependent oxidoreductase [Flavobacteriaceae bacterium AU392]